MIPQRYEHVVFGLILSGLMSFIVWGISTVLALGFAPDFLMRWIGSWLPSWAVAFPAVLIVAPVARRIVGAMVRREDTTPEARH